MLATVVATTATKLSNSCKSTIVFGTFYFRSTETVRCERHVSQGNEQLQASARVKKFVAALDDFWRLMFWRIERFRGFCDEAVYKSTFCITLLIIRNHRSSNTCVGRALPAFVIRIITKVMNTRPHLTNGLPKATSQQLMQPTRPATAVWPTVITLRASCGAVNCNRSCLWVGVFVGGSVTMKIRNCEHRSSPNWVCRWR